MYGNEYLYGEDMDISELRFPRPLTVSEVNEFIKQLFDEIPQLRRLSVEGEISNFKNHYSTGHLYFTLKDSGSSIRAVMFKTNAQKLKFALENGMKVTVKGRIASYVRDGQYQIYCEDIEPAGLGALYAAYEQLKKELSKEGFFDEEHKKKIPSFPRRVGIVTSETGAAVRDMLNVIGRRCPMTEVFIYPSLVQGEGAPYELISGIEYFNSTDSVDVIIIGRGGGSIEDLWAFNDKGLACAIYNSDIPIISAVGHETDFTISDFVADLRAPTPSAAAELAVPDTSELRVRIDSLSQRMYRSVDIKLTRAFERLNVLSKSRALRDQFAYIEDRNMALVSIYDRLCRAGNIKLDKCNNVLSLTARNLNGLSPLNILNRGYSAVFSENKVVKSVRDVKAGDILTVRSSDGTIYSEVIKVSEDKK